MNLTKKQRSVLVKRLCGMWGVKYKIRRMSRGFIAEANHVTRTIALSNQEFDRDAIVSAVLHEIGHCEAYKNKKYTALHCRWTKKELTIKRLVRLKRTLIRAELYVDKWAEKQAKQLFPQVEFVQSYKDELQRLWTKIQMFKWANERIAWLKYRRSQKKVV